MQTCNRPGSYVFDEEYLSRLRNDDEQTCDHFATYFARFLNWRLRSKCRNREMIDDVRQETLRRVLEAARNGALRDASRLEAFVNSVCNHVLLEYWRAAKKHSNNEPCPDAIDHRSDPETRMRKAEAVGRLNLAMAALPERYREVLKMVYLEETDLSEASIRLRVSPGYTRVLVHRAIVRLRQEERSVVSRQRFSCS